MPSESRRSPRAAIRTWLAKTEQQVKPDDSGLARNLNSADSNTETTNPRSKRYTNAEGLNDGVRKSVPVQKERKPSGRKRAELEGDQNGASTNNVGLAERLGLHAPFRTFADHDTNEYSERRRRKRGRSLSISSLLEPAEEPLDSQDNHTRSAIDGAGTRATKPPLSDVDSPSRGPSLSGQPANRYERRPRRKTKEDKYKMKQDSDKPNKQRAGREKKKGTDKPNKRRKRNEKSGDALMHTFSAPNVAQERLTIRPAAPVGLFGKGRASSPVRRRGLPDLTFSEMTFLNPRRPKADTAVKQAPDKKRRKRDKMIDAEAEMSRYFTSKRPERKENVMDQGYKRSEASAVGSLGRGIGDVDRSARVSSLPPVDLPDRPFLGFGSSGAMLTSPVRVAVHRDLPSRRSTRSESRSSRRSSIGSSSYYSWSTSAPSGKDDGHSGMDMMPAEISHDLQETPQAHSPGPQRPKSTPNKKRATKPQEATDCGMDGKQQVVVEKPTSMTPSAQNNARIEPQEEELSRDILPEPREAAVQEAHSGDSAQTCSQIRLDKKDGLSCLELNTEHHGHISALKPGRGNGNRFPYSFDTALEDLLKTCNVSLNRSEDLMATSIGNEPSNQTQSRGSPLGTSGREQNASITDQTKRFTSDRAYPDGQASSREFGPRSSTNGKANSDLAPPKNVRDPPPNPMPEVSKLQTHSPRGTWSGHKPVELQNSMGWHQNEQQHNNTSIRASQGSLPSGAWHGYQALYENQVFPDDGADRNTRYTLDAEDQGQQDEQEWFQHHPIDADVAEPEFQFEGTDENLYYAQQGLEDSHTNSHDWESTTHPPYDELYQRQPLNDNDIDIDVRHRNIYRFSDSGYGRSTIASGEVPHSPISALGRPDDNLLSEARAMDTTSVPDVYGERINHRWQPVRIDDNETYLTNFWRPNRLY